MLIPRLDAIRPRSIGIFAGLGQSNELVVALVVGEVEACRKPNRLECELPRPLEPWHERGELALARRSVPTADADVDRVHLSAADHGHHLVADLLQLERALDGSAVVARHLDRALVAEEIGEVEHEDVERMALDPLAAVEK